MSQIRSSKTERFIALLRGINVTDRNMIPMADLRALCTKNGMAGVETYIQSGNLIFSAAGKPELLEAEIERLIERRFKFSIPVIVRRASAWPAYIESNPFPDESKAEGNRVMLALSKRPPVSGAVDGLRARAANGERVEQTGDALWIYFPGGSGTSKLSPGLLDRLVGSPVTTRNWRTVLKLGEMTEKS
jgi:uncharacterized protein (DUF1697 family)